MCVSFPVSLGKATSIHSLARILPRCFQPPPNFVIAVGGGGTADSPVPHAPQETRLGGLLRKTRLACRRYGVGGVALLVHEAAVFCCGGLGRGEVLVDGHGYGDV